MKKLIFILVSLLLIVSLVGCGKEKVSTYTFKGRVIEKRESSILVEPLEGEDIRRSADKISVALPSMPELNPPAFPVGTLVEIEYDGNIAETYPAQITAITLRTLIDDEEQNSLLDVPVTVVYANWAENFGGLLTNKCLNVSKMVFSDVPRMPLLKFESKKELEAFQNEYRDTFSLSLGYDEMPSFEEVITNYDDTFFEANTLFLAYKEASSGSFRYTISDVKKENGTLIFIISQTNHPDVYTEDMAGWFLMAEVKNSELEGVTSFDAQFPEGVSKGSAYEESDTLTIKNGRDDDQDSQNKSRIEKFIENVQNGNHEYITITSYTIEGDPITTTIKYGGKEAGYLVTRDTTKDQFGPQEIVEKEYNGEYQAVLEEQPLELMPGEVHNYTYWTFKLIKDGEEDVFMTTFRFPKES